MEKTYLNLGCGPYIHEGFESLDNRLEAPEAKYFDLLSYPWKYNDKSVDGITSMHVLIEFNWRQIVSILRESYRVLKDDGVLRIGAPHIDSGKNLDWLLGWGNITLISYELMEKVLSQIGFKNIRKVEYRQTFTDHKIIVNPDNRQDETLFIEATK